MIPTGRGNVPARTKRLVLSGGARRAGVHAVAAPLLEAVRLLVLSEADLRLHAVAADPDDPVATHDGIDRVRLLQERLRVRARHLVTRKEVPAAIAARLAVEHAHRTLPPGALAGLSRHDVRPRGLGRVDVRRRDAVHENRLAANLADHAPHEFGRIGPVLDGEV